MKIRKKGRKKRKNVSERLYCKKTPGRTQITYQNKPTGKNLGIKMKERRPWERK